jgi:hypothetical protein
MKVLDVMVRIRVTSSLALACLALLAAQSALRADPRAVVELFTSQGCSSCPPADKLAGELARDPSIVVMSLAIDYWDYLGWKDTLALAGNSSRQRAYAKSRGDRDVYTPQVVVNGIMHVNGSDKPAIERAIVKTRSVTGVFSVPVALSIAGDKLTVNVPAAADSQTHGEIWLCPMTKAVPVAIGRGENRGNTVTYSNVVRRWVKLGEWTGKAESFTVPVGSFQTGDIDQVAVMVQGPGGAGTPKIMLGAAQASLR